MPQGKISFYAVQGTDGEPRVFHAVGDYVPEGGVEINEVQAMQISSRLRANQPAEPESAATDKPMTSEEIDARIRLAIKDVLSQLAEGANADQ